MKVIIFNVLNHVSIVGFPLSLHKLIIEITNHELLQNQNKLVKCGIYSIEIMHSNRLSVNWKLFPRAFSILLYSNYSGVCCNCYLWSIPMAEKNEKQQTGKKYTPAIY